MVKKIPGGWITVLVGGAAFIYLLGEDSQNPTLKTFSDDTVGRLANVTPKGVFGLFIALATVGAFLNKETVGKLT